MLGATALELVTVIVDDYDPAIAFFVEVLGFALVEDSPSTTNDGRVKRWVVVRPPGARECGVLLARASSEHQATRIGDQTGGRVFLFLFTDNLARDHARYLARGVEFVRPPTQQPYGTVAVFKDVCGNLWDLIQPASQ